MAAASHIIATIGDGHDHPPDRSAAVPPLVLGMCDPCPTPTPSPADPMLGTLWNRVSAMEDTIQNTLPYPPDSM